MNHLRQLQNKCKQFLVTKLTRRNFGGKYTRLDFYEELMSTLKRKKLLLRAAMTKKHKFVVHPPKYISREPLKLPPFNLSELAGHGSFILLAISYLENDFLSLRLYAFSGITLSIIFQYYRDVPLWIPIRWNNLFLLINAVMIGLLIKKQSDAANMTEDQKKLYEQCFRSKGMSQVDFFHLISTAKRMEAKKGTKLVSMDKKNTRLYLVQKGSLSVYKHDQKIGTINETQFVGEMSYLRWQTKKHERESMRIAEEEKVPKIYEEKGSTSLSWKTAETALNSILKVVPETVNNSSVPSSETASENGAVPNVVASMNDESKLAEAAEKLETLVISTSFGAESAEMELISTSAVQAAAVQVIEEDEGHLGQANVICKEDCVVYYWKFKDLYQLISDNPLLGLVIERSFSEDLNNKMTNSWQEELRLRYKMLVSQAVQRYHQDKLHSHMLALRTDTDGEVLFPTNTCNVHSEAVLDDDQVLVGDAQIPQASAGEGLLHSKPSIISNGSNIEAHADTKDIADLAKFRTINNIPDLDHDCVLQEVLIEQEKLDRQRVAEKIQDTSTAKQYRFMLKNELQKPRGISDSAKKMLREFRLTYQISADAHLALLQDFGWTLDEFEMGRRLTTKDLQYFKARASQPTSPTSSPARKSSLETLLTTRYGKNADVHLDDDDYEDESPHQSFTSIADDDDYGELLDGETSSGRSKGKQADAKNEKAMQQRAQRFHRALSQAGLHDSNHHGGDHPIDELHLHLVLDDEATYVPYFFSSVRPSKGENNGADTTNDEPKKKAISFLSRIGRGGLINAVFFPHSTAHDGNTNVPSSSSLSSSDDGRVSNPEAEEVATTSVSFHSSDPTLVSSHPSLPQGFGASEGTSWVPGWYLYHTWSGVTSLLYGSSSSNSDSSSEVPSSSKMTSKECTAAVSIKEL